MCWDHDERTFVPQALSLGVAATARDRSDRAPRSSAPAEDAPLVIAAEVKSALRLAAVNDAAARLGLKPGMALADARAMYPTIAVADADPEADRRLLVAIADWCDRYTPLVGLDPPDGLMLDITGCAHLFGGEAALCRDIVRRLALQGFARPRGDRRHGRLRLGGGALRRLASDSACRRGIRAAGASLLALPLAALRIAPDVVIAALAQVGLKRIADVLERPRAPLAARFGEHFVRRIDQALGREDEPITPRLPVPPYVAERRFADPILLEADVLRTIEQLAHELARLLERRGEGARRPRSRAVPHRRQGAPDRGRHRRAAARSRAHPARCSPSGSPRSATTAIPASASMWCASRRSRPSAAIRCRPASPRPIMPPSLPISSIAWARASACAA